jgi:hypothetical protein
LIIHLISPRRLRQRVSKERERRPLLLCTRWGGRPQRATFQFLIHLWSQHLSYFHQFFYKFCSRCGLWWREKTVLKIYLVRCITLVVTLPRTCDFSLLQMYALFFRIPFEFRLFIIRSKHCNFFLKLSTFCTSKLFVTFVTIPL